MLHSAEVVEIVAEAIEKYHIRNVVLDPVMVSTSGHRLIEEDAIGALRERLLPLARVITPNPSRPPSRPNIFRGDPEP